MSEIDAGNQKRRHVVAGQGTWRQMNIVLSGVIRSESQRQNAPAVLVLRRRAMKGEARLNPGARILLRTRRRLGVFRRMMQEALMVSGVSPARLVMARGGHKFEQVKAELVGAGADTSDLIFMGDRGRRSLRSLMELPGLFFKLLALWVILSWRTRGRLSAYREVICLHAVFARELEKKPKTHWLFIGDLSPVQIALAGAARRSGHGVISWQWDYLDFKRFPVKPDFAAVLNETGIRLAHMSDDDLDEGRVLWRPGVPQKPLDLGRIHAGPVGVLLNAFADTSALEILSEVQAALGRPLLLRLHPNSRLWEMPLPRNMTKQERGAPMEAFFASVGMVLAGNTQTQFNALCHGLPVIQLAKLDPLVFDHHGYVRRGIVFGVREISDLDLAEVVRFYSADHFATEMRTLLGPRPEDRLPPLSALLESV
jgi:hypothetical protein